jgi:acetolactate synthase-1/3 small subunit
MEKKNQFVIAVYVDNQSGVLTRVTSMFTRRGFNIDALTVGETECSEYSRITISLSGDGYAREQLINQLRKLYNVKKVEVLEHDCIQRELMLIKVKNDAEHRAEVFSAVDVYRAKVIDYTADEMCVEITGDPSKIDAFIKLMMTYDIIIELCRTGIVALERGSNTLFNK